VDSETLEELNHSDRELLTIKNRFQKRRDEIAKLINSVPEGLHHIKLMNEPFSHKANIMNKERKNKGIQI
jgi:hypothetical protein